MILEFTLPCKGFSINRYYYSDKRHKTKEAREWEELILHHLDQEKGLVDMADTFKEKGKSFRVELTFKYPYNVYYNASKQISSRTFDLSNVEKVLLDLIFGKTMEINDKYIVELLSRKEPAALHSIDVKIEILEQHQL